ncbi:cyclic nucleotide-binding domain protein (macronuclear) [Tetrahymena thermophila SB210]|uniref:Cyclic nucleotide-binding domain protein n=1 Tax=Tetrahymena thermophila (strain SB210) TaxID=312017 RepID=I7LXJ4_TETTS|nr:cyclic nucleotide-binding domain protein [Tetrahymena thermophila SB210]EAS04757.2 cyclic nucleotide-binding domain protein [Tetrahymena thermophila SB210]|eukprot:XP_001025002.2 cyclic nucleotide-binding domain protein [Tetrahymena thermophila SB210]
MGQVNCLQNNDKNKNQKQNQQLSPQDFQEESDLKNAKLVFEIYKKLCLDLLKPLEKLLYKLQYYLFNNEMFQNNQSNIQIQNNNPIDQSLIFNLKKQEEEWYSEVLAHKVIKESQSKQNMLDNQNISNEQFFKLAIADMISQIIQIINIEGQSDYQRRQKLNQITKVEDQSDIISRQKINQIKNVEDQLDNECKQKQLNIWQIRSLVKDMEDVLQQFLQIQHKPKSDHVYRNCNEDEDETSQNYSQNMLNHQESLDETCDESQETKYKQRQIDKKFLSKYLSHEDQQEWFIITQKIENILPNKKNVDLKLKQVNSQVKKESFILKSEAQQSMFSNASRKLMIINAITKQEKKVEIEIQNFPYSHNEIINVHQNRKQILFYNKDKKTEKDNLLFYINYKKIKGDTNLREKIRQFKLHLKLLHPHELNSQNNLNHQNSADQSLQPTFVFNLYEPLYVIKIKNHQHEKNDKQEYFLAYKSDVSYFTMQQFIGESSKLKLSELEFLIVIKDMIKILKQLEKNKIGHRNISTETLLYYFKNEQKQWVLKDLFKSQIIEDIYKKQEITTIYGKIEYVSPEISKEIQANTSYFSKFSLKAQDVYAMGIVLAKLKLCLNQPISGEQIDQFLINDKVLRNKDLKVSDYIIGLMLSPKEKDRMDFNYDDIITLIEEEFFSLYKVYKIETEQNPQKAENKNILQNHDKIINFLQNEVTDNQLKQYNDFWEVQNLPNYEEIESQQKQANDMESSQITDIYQKYQYDKSFQSNKENEAQEKERIERERKEKIENEKKEQKIEQKRENRLKKLLEFLKFIKNFKNRDQYQKLAEEILLFIQNKMKPSQQNLHEEFDIIQQLIQLHDESLEQIENNSIIEDQQKIGEAMLKKQKPKLKITQFRYQTVDEDEYNLEQQQNEEIKAKNLVNLREKECKLIAKLRFNIIERTFKYQNFFQKLKQKQKDNDQDENHYNKHEKLFKKIINNDQIAEDQDQNINVKENKVRKVLNYEFKFKDFEQNKSQKDAKDKKLLSSEYRESKIDIFDHLPLNQNIQLLIKCYDNLVIHRISMEDFLDDIIKLKELLKQNERQIDNLDQINTQIQGYMCKCYYELNEKQKSKEIFYQIENKIEKQFCRILRSQYIEDIRYHEFDPSQWDQETAIDVLKQIQKRDKKNLQQYVEIEIRIAEMYLELNPPNYLEAAYKYQNALALFQQFSQEIEIKQLDILENVSDIYQILLEEKKDKIDRYRDLKDKQLESANEIKNQDLKNENKFSKKVDIFKKQEKNIDYVSKIKQELYFTDQYDKEREKYMKLAIERAKEQNLNQKDINYLKNKLKTGKPNLIKKQLKKNIKNE